VPASESHPHQERDRYEERRFPGNECRQRGGAAESDDIGSTVEGALPQQQVSMPRPYLSSRARGYALCAVSRRLRLWRWDAAGC
jgi:hypothetical protein